MRLLRSSPLTRDLYFVTLWVGQAVSEIGTAVTTLVLPLLAITVLRASTVQIGILNACATLAVIAVSIPGGALVDRNAKVPLMIGCDALRGLLLAAVPILAVMHLLRMTELYAVSALVGALGLLFGVAYHAYYPSLVGNEQLGEANSKIASTEAFARVCGPGLGACLLAVVGAAGAVAADAISYLASVASLVLIWRHGRRTGRTEPGTPEEKTQHQSVFREAFEGFHLVIGDRVLSATAATVIISTGCLAITDAVLMYFLVHDLGLSTPEIGFVWAVGEGGGLAAAIVCGPILRCVGTARIMWIAVLAGPVGLLTAAADHADAVVLTSAFMIISSTRFVLFDVAQYSYRQTVSPPDAIGKVTATVRMSIAVSSTIGSIGGGWLGVAVGARATIVVATVLVSLSGLPVLLSPLRSVRDITEIPAVQQALRRSVLDEQLKHRPSEVVAVADTPQPRHQAIGHLEV
jgi:Na+/melibiose symporter-like transporter